MATINDLSTTTLIKIFSYLDIQSLQRCRRVCKRWQIANTFTWEPMTRLIYCIIPPDEKTKLSFIKNGLEVESSNILCLQSILQMFNGTLRQFYIRASYPSSIDLPEMPESLCQLLNRIENLTCVGVDYDENSELIRLIKCLPARNIRHLLYDFNEHTIDINEAVRGFASLIDGAVNLISLHMVNPPVLTLHVINKMCDLKALYIIGGVLHPSFDIIKMTNLQILSIHACHTIKDDYIIEMVKNCKKLHTVEISHCYEVKYNGTIAITSLPNLRILVSSYMSNHILNKLYNIAEIYCDLEFSLFDSYTCILHFLFRSRNLKKFNFQNKDCNDLTKQLVSKLNGRAVLSNHRLFFYAHWSRTFYK